MKYWAITDIDVDNLYSIRQEVFEFNHGDPLSTLEKPPSLEEFSKSLHDSDCSVKILDDSGKIIGFGTIQSWQENDGTYVYLHHSFISPKVTSRELVERDFLKKLQQVIVDKAKEIPSPQKVFAANSSSTEIDSLKILEADGYKVVWSQVEMELSDLDSLPGLSLPTGFAIKKVTPDIYRKIYDLNKTVYQNTWGATPSSDSDFQDFLEDNPNPDLWTVSLQDDKIAGFVLSHIADGIGVVNEVSILPEFRRLGLAKSLLTLNLKTFKNNGVSIVRLHTDSESRFGARRLYESLGFKSLKVFYRFRKPI